jgi:MoaA/NifB/PqqE/SkfB family radical SAM enzyme
MEVMSQELFASIVEQVATVGEKGVVVFLSNYNEPTVDPLFEERCRLLFEKGLPVTILTNASHFTPERAARLETLGRFRYIGVNLPTLDPERYFQLHGTKDLARVLANVDAMRARSLAEETAIVVLGDEDDAHRRDVEQITARFEPKGWTVKPFKIRSRPSSGTYVPQPPPKKRLRGCELMGSRPFEHLHVTATAKAVLCCQDYYEHLTVGDLKTQTVAQLLGGDTMARLRKWTYGVEEAPADFLCRSCEFALGE